MASSAAFFALPIPTAPTGQPGGNCVIAYSASTPCSGPTSSGSPTTGKSVSAATAPGSAAASPAAAMITR